MKNPLLLLVVGALLLACPKDPARNGPDAAPPTRTEATEAPQTAADAGDTRAAEEACIDRWLEERNLDPYGNPAGTMYAGGTPLFDERTGETRDRLEFVYSRQPEARAACAGD